MTGRAIGIIPEAIGHGIVSSPCGANDVSFYETALRTGNKIFAVSRCTEWGRGPANLDPRCSREAHGQKSEPIPVHVE